MKEELSWGAFLFLLLCFVIGFGLVGFAIGTYFFNNPAKKREYEQLLADLKQLTGDKGQDKNE